MIFHFTHPYKTQKIPDVSGKVVIITGGNTGIGFQSAKILAKKGAQVIIGCRSQTKGEEAVKTIQKEVGPCKIRFILLDLSDFKSVRRFADHFFSLTLPLHILINNAGVMTGPRKTIEEEKIEAHFGVNHLGHFLLTLLLLPKLKESEPSRIIHVSSYANYRGTINFDDLQLEKGYAPFIAYCQSKLANVVFSNELSDRLRGTRVTSNSLHPGDASTEIVRNINPVGSLGKKIVDMVLRTSEQGAENVVYLATRSDHDNVSGTFWLETEQYEPNKEAKDEKVKKELWNRSYELVKNYLR